ncbi:midasin [Microplitis demolitor]|uniref:midasin n=1 Tax=Microplitis demolitor TaxID=69319 RepID=UPI0004CDB723|nr:midasin [Microplitis demolitor]
MKGLLKNLKEFCDKNSSIHNLNELFSIYLNNDDLTEDKFKEVIEKICSHILMDKKYTRHVAEYFPQYLILFLSHAIPTECSEFDAESNPQLHRLNCVILGQLISINPDVLGFTLRYFEVYPAPFETSTKLTPAKKLKRHEVSFKIKDVSDYDVVVATYNILRAASNHFKHKWNWSKFYNFLAHNDSDLKWIALKCVGIVLNMSESVKIACAKALIPNFHKFLINHDVHDSNIILTTDDDDDDNYLQELEKAVEDSESLVSIAGVLLPVFDKTNRVHSSLVPVPSMESNLRSLALAVASRKCVCLQGPVGCGKTALVEYLAKVTGRGSSDFIKVQLGEQTDSKMLLGTYRCTDIPGEFIWQPGVLTQAVVTGKWLLLEDIDSAALDVISVLSNLMETGILSVPGYRDTIYAKSGFQLFVTQRLISSVSGLFRQSANACNLLEKHWLCVHMDPLTKDELIIVIKTLFPVLTTTASKIIDVFLLFSMGNHDTEDGDEKLSTAGRLISTRDLIKWCTRSIVNFNVSQEHTARKLLLDAVDIFCCSVPDVKKRLDLAIAIGHILGIVKTETESMIKTRTIQVSKTEDEKVITAGRAIIHCKKERSVQYDQSKDNFTSESRPSAVLLERVACCIMQNEPVLLVGETGTGKTSSIQHLAKNTGHKLIVINMNQQSESADLLGGYKPVDVKLLITPIREEFEILFRSYFAVEPNRKFLEHLATSYEQGSWKKLVALMSHSTMAAIKRLRGSIDGNEELKTGKKRKSTDDGKKNKMEVNKERLVKWEKLNIKLEKLKSQVKTEFSLAFAFIEGSLIKALQKGYWVLLDEINLASSETLECLSGLLEGSTGSLSLFERGDKESIKRHKDFKIFACMNPATDVGKKELPVGLRNRFTEFYVDELTERSDLRALVKSYLKELNLSQGILENIVNFYLEVRKRAVSVLNDGTGHKPHYSLRTLCRALSVTVSFNCGNILRSLYESFCLSFLTQLDSESYKNVDNLIKEMINTNKSKWKAILNSPIPNPSMKNNIYIEFKPYWVPRGTLEPEKPKDYIITKSVEQNLRDLARVVAISRMPVLIQGNTSVGKTSLIKYLAKASGHICVRINNHEHTDLQEYVGNYVADETGKLMFKEGILVEAMRKGYWIILDELNLAPSDVLEALNRVLDDNRELFIPETQQIIKAHNNFMLFATQNPPGVYGGRKVLSRAFRNRFVELHFDEIPSDELEIILENKCSVPKTYCKSMINVMKDLQMRRKSTAAFMGKHGFITLRDLFRWGQRYKAKEVKNVTDKKTKAVTNQSEKYDWEQLLADEGYLVLASKVRQQNEAKEIREVIEKRFKRDVDPNNLFTLHDKTSRETKSILEALEVIKKSPMPGFEHIVWTYQMRRMAVLVIKSCQFKEPILLVGETGGGKTTVCQLAAVLRNKKLYSVNCHMNTESSDFLGNLRPVREHTEDKKKLFEWVDGPLISAMENGDIFLADEISLADDSVLERMNSLLEPERTLLLAEKNSDSVDKNKDDCGITAHEDFCFIGTMNPGGDYGKKELSPALRNRFTEIWCEGCVSDDDLRDIIEYNLQPQVIKNENQDIATAILAFINYLKSSEVGKKFVVSVRDILTWINFIKICRDASNYKLTTSVAFIEGARLTYLDSLGSGVTGTESKEKLETFKNNIFVYLEPYINKLRNYDHTICDDKIIERDDVFGIDPFYIPTGPNGKYTVTSFTFDAPTTKSNKLKILRALQLKKSLLLEGSPGVGKTSLVSAIAKASGHNLLRINLSDQTDISDLFGADLPVEGGKGGQFAWKDGPFLRALRAGDWILLDELNLASQSVLEGLNACLDHRGEIYIPELARSFIVKPGTKLFACQNPLSQGGARRGLPKSFLNRFTQVFVDALSDNDLKIIAVTQFSGIDQTIIDKIIEFNSIISSEAGSSWGYHGSPWEMNLRDITRWCELYHKMKISDYNDAEVTATELIYVDRMRTADDKEKVRELFRNVFQVPSYINKQPFMYVNEENLYFDNIILPRSENSFSVDHNLLVLRDQIPALKSLAQCVLMNWMPILVGESGTGKSSVVRVLAQLAGQKLRSIVVNSAMDTTEILGGFEQTDYNRHLEQLIEKTENLLIAALRQTLDEQNLDNVSELYEQLEKIKNLSCDESLSTTMAIETKNFLQRTEQLSTLISRMEKLKTLEALEKTELASINDKLLNLSNLVKQENCLNAGGKFEWIDSVLVKCLQDGTWLLIDQVNLCSPAVLDRLNGLLEPGGVLTIGERGVDNDGNIHTIKPHNNFRLFLTMDSRYGEISRAMRNRGVEIFLLGHKGYKSENELDIKSLMFDIGLTRNNHQETMLNINREILSQKLLSDKLSTIQLLHSVFLITQQILRGFSVKKAFTRACIDVYIKSRYIHHSNIKNHLLSIINNIIDQNDIQNNHQSIIDLSAITLNVRDLQDNVKLTLINQQATLLLSLINKYQDSSSTEFLNKYLDPEDNKNLIAIDIKKIVPYLLLMFFEKSSVKDLRLRSAWLQKKLDDLPPDDFIISIKSKIEEITQEIFDNKNDLPDSLPWYRCISNNIESDQNNAQLLSIRLYLKTMDIKYPQKLSVANDKNIITLEKYSDRVCANNEHDDNVAPIATFFSPFISLVNQWINNYLKYLCDCSNNIKYIEIRQDLQWFRRFYEQGKLTFINKLHRVNEKVESDHTEMLLKVHYRWLRKLLTKTFEESNNSLATNEDKKTIETLKEFMEQFDNYLREQQSFKKLTKKIKEQLNILRPFTSELIIKNYKQLDHYSDDLFLPKNNEFNYQLNLVFIQLEETKTIRRKFEKLWENILNDEFNEDMAADVMSSVDIFLNKYKLSNRFNIKEVMEIILSSYSSKTLIEMSSNIKLWPIYEYTFIMFAHKLHCQLNEKLSSDININNSEIVNKFLNLSCVPTNLIAVLATLLNKNTERDNCERLLPELFRYLTQYKTRDTYDHSNFVNCLKSVFEEDSKPDELIESNCKFNYSDDDPVLINAISDILLSQDSKENFVVSTAAIGFYNSHIKQINTINSILWRNSISFNSNEYNLILNDRKAFIDYTDVYLTAIDKIEKTWDINKLIKNNKVNNQDKLTEDFYNECYKNPIDKLKLIRNNLTADCNYSTEGIDRGIAWIYLGFHKYFIFSHLGFIDPVLKTELKLKYINDDIEDLENLIYANKLDCYLFDDDGWIAHGGDSSRIASANKCIDILYDVQGELKKSTGYRSSDVRFVDLAKKVTRFRDDIGTAENIIKTCENLYKLTESKITSSESNYDELLTAVNILINKRNTWKIFYQSLDKNFMAYYRELVSPIINGLSKIIHGANILIDQTNRLISLEKTSVCLTETKLSAQDYLYNLVRFPTIGNDQENLLELIELHTSKNSKEFIIKFIDKSKSYFEVFRMLKNSLVELYNHITLTKQLTKPLWNKLNELLSQICLVWKKQQLEEEKAAAESQSLYKGNVSIHCETLTDDEEMNKQLQELFPASKDFDDIKNLNTLEAQQNLKGSVETIKSCGSLITIDDLEQVYKIHSRIVKSFTSAPWLKHYSFIELPTRDYIDPLLQRYHTFGLLRPELEKSLSADLSKKLHVSLNLLSSITLATSLGENNNLNKSDEKTYDFYKSSNIEEVKQCVEILDGLTEAVENYLTDWPEHPTLQSIKTIITRINNFPITSPVSRFLTGLEILLSKTREWKETAARKGDRLAEYSFSLEKQIKIWRRLELGCWKDCLDSAFKRLQAKASKWWFFIYSIIESYVNKTSLTTEIPQEVIEKSCDNEIVTAKKLIKLLEIFMTQSSLVEFKARLDLLLTFHSHVFYLEPSVERDELLSIFWNIYNYYNKFTDDVDKKISQLKTTVGKEIKDQVTIANRTNIDRWTVEELVKKVHRKLLDCIKKYETVLKESVGKYLTFKSSNESSEDDKDEWNRHKIRYYSINPEDFIVSDDKFNEIYPVKSKGLRADIVKHLNEIKNSCRNTILSSVYPGLRIELEQRIEEFITHATELKNMKVNDKLSIEKQKSHAKSILQTKKKALKDYFDTLKNFGFSYRRGLADWRNSPDQVQDFTVPPLDISRTLERLESLGESDKQMLTHWDGSEHYYYQSCIKLNALISTLTKTQTDLGPMNMDQCKGYSVNIITKAHKQKIILGRSINIYAALRQQVSNLSNIDYKNLSLPRHQDIAQCANELNDLLACLSIGLEQIEIYLQACPRDNLGINDQVIVLESSDLPLINATKGDQTWESASVLIKDAIKSISTLSTDHSKLFSNTSVASFIRTHGHFKSLENSCKNILKINKIITTLGEMFGSEKDKDHPLLATIKFLMDRSNQWIDKFNVIKKFESDPGMKNDSGIQDIRNKIKCLVEIILRVIKTNEEVSQSDVSSNDITCENKNDDDKEENEDSLLDKNGLRKHLIESLEKDIKNLEIEKINKQLENIIFIAEELNPLYTSYYNSCLLTCLPLLNQYILFTQFYLTEQVAAFRVTCKLLYLQLKFFLNLSANGFCVPKNLDDNEADANGGEDSKSKDGMGLGDGEGKKDVSDKIESEDQLEEARPADEEEKNEDGDCKEEDKGIEMSDNFDGKLQDLDKNDNDQENSDDENDDNDLDKEMGETETGADQMTDDIWGDDTDESETEEQVDDTDEQGKGEQAGEKELGARDESKHQGEDKKDDNNGEEEKEDKDKPEINEMNEPDINDDQIDPYHGKHNPQPEPEPMDLPDDLNLDGEDEAKEDKDEAGENPFDIDAMKEAVPPENDDTEADNQETNKNADENLGDDSSDEEGGPTTEDTEMKDLDSKEPEEPEASDQQVPDKGEEKNEEEDQPNKENEEEKGERAVPSTDDGSKETDTADQLENKVGSRDKVANDPNQESRQDTAPMEENSQDDGNDKGTGQAQSNEQNEGHFGSTAEKNTTVQQQQEEQKSREKRKNPGESDENRALIDKAQPNKKKQRIINTREELGNDEDDTGAAENKDNGDIDMCQHVKNTEKFDDYATDAATEEQAKKQTIADDEEEPDARDEELMDVDMHDDKEEIIEEDIKKMDAEPTPKTDKDMAKSSSKNSVEETCNMETKLDVEGDIVPTVTVAQEVESAFYTNLKEDDTIDLTQEENVEEEKCISRWIYKPSSEQALTMWNNVSSRMETAARDLSEKLRLVLEPTQATRLRGDYRTGKRINMRKIIPYIASQFRKDKIWLRRTKPSKRNYQILLALDDSSSMKDNLSHELTFESISLISKAMEYLEVGDLGVISFGEKVEILHPLGKPFNEESGSRLIEEMNFEQKKTKIVKMINDAVDMFEEQRSSTDSAKLLIILSDGRINEQENSVNLAVRRAQLANIFLVYIIIETPEKRDSVLDITKVIPLSAKEGGGVQLLPYMDSFPFKFYMILRNINSLPGILSDALRQWFEIVGKIDT